MRSSSYLVLAFRIKLEQIKYKNNNQTARKYQRNVIGISLLIRTVIPEPMVIHISVNVDSATGFCGCRNLAANHASDLYDEKNTTEDK